MATTRAIGLARHFSTSSAAKQLVKPPIQLFGTEGRYAHALFSAASKQNAVDKVDKEMKSIQGLLKTDTKFADFIVNPTVQRTTKKEAVLSALKKQNFSDLTVNFFAAMAENGRLSKVHSYLNAYNKIMSAVKGELTCVVTTAQPLDAKQEKELMGILQSFVKQGQSISVSKTVDESLIGGMQVFIGDKFIDMSIASKIKAYEDVILRAKSDL